MIQIGAAQHPAQIDKGSVLTAQVGNAVLHIPKDYIDGVDGSQGSSGYVRIRAELPCLTPIMGVDPRLLGKGWGNALFAKFDILGPSNLTGQKLLDVFVDDNRRPSAVRKGNPDRDADDILISGTDFHLYENNLLGLDFFARATDGSLFLLQCARHSEFPYPLCSKRTIFEQKYLIDYDYGRSMIDQNIALSLQIDAKIVELFHLFLAEDSSKSLLEHGVCK